MEQLPSYSQFKNALKHKLNTISERMNLQTNNLFIIKVILSQFKNLNFRDADFLKDLTSSIRYIDIEIESYSDTVQVEWTDMEQINMQDIYTGYGSIQHHEVSYENWKLTANPIIPESKPLRNLSQRSNYHLERPSFNDQPIDTDDFDIFYLKKISNNQELLLVVYKSFLNLGILSEQRIPYRSFVEFWRSIQVNQNNTNPQHNKTHAADVTWFVQDWCRKTSWTQNGGQSQFNSFDMLCLLFSAGVHDFKHPGYTNNQLTNTCDEVAITQNDYSVLEMQHISEAFRTLREYNFLLNLDKKKTLEFRAICIKLVLGTDMANHFIDIKELKNILDLSTDEKTGINYEGILNDKHKTTLMKALLHLCDISSPMKEPRMSYIWGQRCVMEFFMQGDKEKKLGLPLASELFDRDLLNQNKSQVGFYEFVVLPMYKIVSQIISDPQKENIEKNLKMNKEKIEETSLIVIKNRIPNQVVPDIFEEQRSNQEILEEDERKVQFYQNNLNGMTHLNNISEKESSRRSSNSVGELASFKSANENENEYDEIQDANRKDSNSSRRSSNSETVHSDQKHRIDKIKNQNNIHLNKSENTTKTNQTDSLHKDSTSGQKLTDLKRTKQIYND